MRHLLRRAARHSARVVVRKSLRKRVGNNELLDALCWAWSAISNCSRSTAEDLGFVSPKRGVAFVMAGHSRPKDGVAPLAYVPAIHAFLSCKQGVDTRDKRGHDGGELGKLSCYKMSYEP